MKRIAYILGTTALIILSTGLEIATTPGSAEAHTPTVQDQVSPDTSDPGLSSTAKQAEVKIQDALLTADYHRWLNGDRRYVVREGNTLSSISGKEYGKDSDWPVIYRANHMHSTLIRPGQVLRIPDKLPRHIPVIRGFAASSGAFMNTSTYLIPSAPPTHSGDYSFSALESLWVSAGGPSWAESAAATVAECESGGNPDAYNASGASGLWQILGAVVPGNLFDPMVNAENAVSKFTASGDTWAQWVCQP